MYLLPHCERPRPLKWMRSKCSKNFFFFTFTTVSHEPIWFVWHVLIFTLLDWQFEHFNLMTSLKVTISSSFSFILIVPLSNTICVLLNVQLFSKEHFLVTAFVIDCLRTRIWESSPKFSRIPPLMKHYMKMFVTKQFLRKAFFSRFWFSLKRLVGLEHKRLSRHRLLDVTFSQ